MPRTQPIVRPLSYDVLVKENLINGFGCADMSARLTGPAEDGFRASGFLALRRPSWPFRGCEADSSSCRQPPSHQEQVAEGEEREQLGAVLGEAAISALHVTELALDDPEGLRDLGADHRDDAVDPFVEGVKLTALGSLSHRTPNLARCLEGSLALGIDIAVVGPD